MERLTYKVSGYNRLKNGYGFRWRYAESKAQDAIDKLADYEDAEEQGLILRLPCKVGDTIYKIPSKVNYNLNVLNGYLNNNKVYEQKIYYIKMYNSSRYLIATCEGLDSVLSDDYKKTWFLTKEEAEQALKRMESE